VLWRSFDDHLAALQPHHLVPPALVERQRTALRHLKKRAIAHPQNRTRVRTRAHPLGFADFRAHGKRRGAVGAHGHQRAFKRSHHRARALRRQTPFERGRQHHRHRQHGGDSQASPHPALPTPARHLKHRRPFARICPAACAAADQMILHQHPPRLAQRARTQRCEIRTEDGAGSAVGPLQPLAHAGCGRRGVRHISPHGFEQPVEVLVRHRRTPAFRSSCCNFFLALCSVTATTICVTPNCCAISGFGRPSK
jgi:hypothetical protein